MVQGISLASPNLNPFRHLWDKLEKQVQALEVPPHNLRDLQDQMLTLWCQVASEATDKSCFAGDLHNNSQVVLMLWLIGVSVKDKKMNNRVDLEENTTTILGNQMKGLCDRTSPGHFNTLVHTTSKQVTQ